LDYFKSRPLRHPQETATNDAHGGERGADSGLYVDGGGPAVRHVTTDIGGKLYRIESDDRYLDTIRGAFEPHMVELFDTLVKPSDTVLDIGANIGCTSILFGSRARRVVSFEPSPSTYQFLQKNVQASGLQNIDTRNLGLGKTAGRFELTFSVDNRSGGFVSNQMQASAGHQVEAIEIVQGDAFLKQAGIGSVDFVKIDVEGFERDVIEGLRDTMSASRPVVTLELNHWCLNVLQRTSVPDFLDFLRSVFPYLYAVDTNDIRNLYDPNDAYHVMFRHVAGGFQYPNLVGAFDPVRLEAFGARYGRTIA
jgi:FkbM family methyltransferase